MADLAAAVGAAMFFSFLMLCVVNLALWLVGKLFGTDLDESAPALFVVADIITVIVTFVAVIGDELRS